MTLRNHPLMSHNNIRNWPPIWVYYDGDNLEVLRRVEVGTLQRVMIHERLPDKIFLVVTHKGNRYIASLTFDNSMFCRQMWGLLNLNIGRSIQEIGDLDLSSTF